MIIILITLATIVSTTLGGLFAIRLRDHLHLILGFSAGAVLGVALFDLLPESIELADNIQLTTLLIATGFCVYMILDRFLSFHNHNDSHCENPAHEGGIGAGALVLHSILDGFGIGLAFKISPAIGLVVALAVLVHDFSDGINTVNMIIKNKGNRKTAIKWLIADSLAPAFGVGATYFLTVSQSVLGLILSVFVGFFLYLSASDLIPESHHRHPAILTTTSTVIGMALIYLVVNLTK